MEIVGIIISLFILYIVYTSYPIYYILFNLNVYGSFNIKNRFKYSISSIIVGPVFGIIEFCLYTFQPNYRINFYILFNFYHIVGNMSFMVYIYRGLVIIYMNKEKTINNIKKVFILIYLIGFFYTIIIDTLIYYEIIEPIISLFSYHYFIIIKGLVLHLKIIYELYKTNNDIKYDYLFSFIFVLFTNIIYFMYPDSLFSKYKITISTFLSYVPYIIIPLIIFWRDKNINKESAIKEVYDIFINDELNQVSNINIKGETEINDLYIGIYEHIYKKQTGSNY